MRAFLLSIALVSLMSLPATASAQNRLESWLNGYAMEVNRMEALYMRAASNVGCCADSKAKIAEQFDNLKASIRSARESRDGGFLCRRMDLLEMRTGLTSMWMTVLYRETQSTHRGSVNAANAALLETVANSVRELEGAVVNRARQYGCTD